MLAVAVGALAWHVPSQHPLAARRPALAHRPSAEHYFTRRSSGTLPSVKSQPAAPFTRRRLSSGCRLSEFSESELPPADSAVADSCPTPEVRTLGLLRFIVPTLAGWLSSEVMSVVDTAVVGASSANELAALGPATMIIDSSAYLFFWLNVATTSLFAAALAKRKQGEAYDVLSDALWCALGCGVGLTAAIYFGGGAALASICAQAPSVIPAATKYLSIRLLGLPAFMVGMVLQAACLGAKDSLSPLVVLLIAGGLNLGLDLYLVRVLSMGIGGAAIATLAAQLVQVALLAGVVTRKRRLAGEGSSWLLLRGRPQLGKITSFVKYAGPMAFVLFGKISCYNAMTLAATASGVASLAAHQVLMSVFFLGCKFGDAVSQTAQAYLPACYPAAGAEQKSAPASTAGSASTATLGAPPVPAQRLSFRLLRVAVLFGILVSLAGFGVVTRFPTIFTADAAVTANIRRVAPLLFAALSVHAATMCSEGLLIAAAEFGFLARSYAVYVGVFLTAVAAVARRKLGLPRVWQALAAFQFVRLASFLWRARAVGLLAARGEPSSELAEDVQLPAN